MRRGGIGRGKDLVKPAWMTTSAAAPSPSGLSTSKRQTTSPPREQRRRRRSEERRRSRSPPRSRRRRRSPSPTRRPPRFTPDRGDIYHGQVVNVTPFGAFVRVRKDESKAFGDDRSNEADGLVHISKLADRRVDNVEDVVQVGDRVIVRVMDVEEEPGRQAKVALSMKDVDQATGAPIFTENQQHRGSRSGGGGSARRRGPSFTPALYSIWKATVVTIKEFGCFVRVERPEDRAQVQGLVHVSQLADQSGVVVEEFVQQGDQVYVKVIELKSNDENPDDVQVSFSMKYVHQGTGKDLDANNARVEMDKLRKRNMGTFDVEKAQAKLMKDAAHRDATVTSFVDPKACKYTGQVYGMVGEADLPDVVERVVEKRKRRRDDVDDSDSESESGGRKHGKKKKKKSSKKSKHHKKKHHKKKKSSSSRRRRSRSGRRRDASESGSDERSVERDGSGRSMERKRGGSVDRKRDRSVDKKRDRSVDRKRGGSVGRRRNRSRERKRGRSADRARRRSRERKRGRSVEKKREDQSSDRKRD